MSMAKTIIVDVTGLNERQHCEIRNHAKNLQTMMACTDETYEAPRHGWTCFHCGQTFHDTAQAAAHFGGDPIRGIAACLMKKPK